MCNSEAIHDKLFETNLTLAKLHRFQVHCHHSKWKIGKFTFYSECKVLQRTKQFISRMTKMIEHSYIRVNIRTFERLQTVAISWSKISNKSGLV